MSLKVFSLEGRVAFLTGASGTLGRAVALALASAGADIIASGRREEALLETAEGVRALGRRALPVRADIRVPEEIEEAVEEAFRAFGRIDILFNAAGSFLMKPLLEMSPGEWEGLIEVNLTDCFRVARTVGRAIIEGGRGGSVINLSSVWAIASAKGVSAYSASRGAVTALTKTLALEWLPFGVRVNAIAPGFLNTPLMAPLKGDARAYEATLKRIPMGRWGEPWELGGAAVLLASEASSFMTGQTLYLDGGWLAQ